MTKTQLQAMLVIAAIGAGLAMVHLLGAGGELVGLGLMIVATIVTASSAPDPETDGINWWTLLATGTALALVGVPLGLVLAAPGGLLTVVGGALVIVGVVFGMPVGGR
jgi:prepilin signal peptidase PulO-like enzyme (type II secretory pathway)